MNTTTDIVAKLWSLCNVLRDDGITYLQYVTELTYLLFLKMMQETGKEDVLPEGYRWNDLVSKEGIEQLTFYRALLLTLGSESANDRIQAIFANAQTALKKPKNLATLVSSLDSLDWYSAKEEGLGDLYEGPLEKNASEKKSGAGQYFTPRPLIDCACIVYLNQRSLNVTKRLHFLTPKDIAVCSVVKAKLFYGANRSNNPQRTLALQKKFLNNFVSLPFDDKAAIAYGKIRSDLAAKGTPIGPYDLQIAAIALANNLILVTHNTREFSRIADLKLEDWKTDYI